MNNRKSEAAVRLAAALLAAVLLFSLTGCAKLRAFLRIPGGPEDESGLSPDHSNEKSTDPEHPLSPEDSSPYPIIPVIPELTFPETTVPVLPEQYRDPLTGLKSVYDTSLSRPAALLYDNCNAACPQGNISRAGIVIEVPAENGQTALCALVNVSASLPGSALFGPLAPATANAVSVASAFGSILFCSGRDEAADDLIQENNADVIDALDERFGGSGFWRDVERVNTYGYTHSMSVSANAVASLPTLYGFAAPSAPVPDFLNFTDGGQPASWASANHVVITYSEVQRVQLIYDLKTQNYVRFQFGAKPHVDGEDASSLAFRNIILLIASPAEKSETALRLTGTGSGIYITSGKSSPITWTRESEADAFRFAFNNGKTPVFNSGKTLICVIPSSVSDAGGIMTDYNQKRDGALK